MNSLRIDREANLLLHARRKSFVFSIASWKLTPLLLVIALGSWGAAAELELTKGEHICLVGNALGEGLQHQNEWETLLHQRFSDLELTVRNLCFPGDEPFNRIRSENFGAPDVHLKYSQASAVLFFFGFNESFAGESGLSTFQSEMQKLVEETKTKNYSGNGAPKIVLISPIAFENSHDPNLPDGKEHNARLEKYTAALAKVAKATEVGFVDLFSPTKALFENSKERLTLNGSHLNRAGYAALGEILNDGLFDKGQSAKVDPKLKAVVDDKNFHWWHRYRAVNGYSIYGARGEAGSDGTYRNREVMEREREILDQMTANRDARIWATAAGKPVPATIDDSNTLPFIVPKTNVGGGSDPNAKAGKLGSLDYLKATEQQKKFKLAEGYEINLFASEEEFPELANPVALNFDNQGRLWVATMASYPHWQPKTPMDDKLLIFEDKNRDGRADQCKVFAGGLHQPTGFEIGRGGVYVAQQPDILFLKDNDGDDREDERTRQLFGFDSADSHHGLAAFRWGPDGGLYFQEGTFKYSQVESSYGLNRLAEGGIWRYDPRTQKFRAYTSFAFANPWGHVFDKWGQDFIGDASPGFSYWAAPISGKIDYPMKHPGGSQHKRVAKLIGGDPNYQFPTLYPKRTRPLAGCEFVSSRHFPDDVQGNFLVTNCIGDRAVLNHAISEQDSGFVGREVPAIISCEDGNFRPVDVQIAPDGSLYVVDWHNALIGHLQHNLRDPNRDHIHGRIWRITYKGRPLVAPAKIAGEPIPALLDLLRLPENNTRYRVRRELAERKTVDVMAAMKAWNKRLDKSDPEYEHLLLESLWLCQTHNVVDADLLQQLLDAKDHRARSAAVRVLSFWMDQLPNAFVLIKPRILDPHSQVRLEAVRALSFSEGDVAVELALDILSKPMDEMLQYTLDETMRALSPTQLFLSKETAIVEYQLGRLGNTKLLAVQRSTENRKYLPVYRAILTRTGVPLAQRTEALAAISEMEKSNPVSELLTILTKLESKTDQQKKMASQLTDLLLKQPKKLLANQSESLTNATKSKNSTLRPLGFAALIVAGQGQSNLPSAKSNESDIRDWLAGVALVPNDEDRNRLRDAVVSLVNESNSPLVRRDAVQTLGTISTLPKETFQLVSPLIGEKPIQTAAVRTLLKTPAEARDAKNAQHIIDVLINHAESTKPADRTTDEFIDAMTLADQLLVKLPEDSAASARKQLSDVSVRVIKLRTVEEEMRYDQPYFAVEAGRSVQIILDNEDLMPHNLVITAPGTLKEVAEEGLAAGPDGGWKKMAYVPKSKNVLFAMPAVPAFSKERLTFTAPKTPGEYPYVCTFPQHWLRMYGVMVVVDDLDEWLKNPVKPKDPIGNNRSFVKNWKVDDLQTQLADGVRGRSAEIGKRLFTEASCASCHKVKGEGGVLGPELTDVFTKWKGDKLAVLREVIEPSHKIDEKFAMHLILTTDSQTLSGIVIAEDKNSVTLLVNQETKAPLVIPRDDIEEMTKSTASIMPKALLDQYTQDEIFEIIAYLESAGTANAAAKQ
ncbi:MAG: PVC-type heme-binding CxxCH protein [Pirellulaceae bacterium]|nr:PVC-type heme-binding CxxCH protein [Pirellulaceae bacterium]